MKKAYVLLGVLFLVFLIAFYLQLNFNISSYASRTLKDTRLYLQAKILAQNAKELAKYFLYEAKKQNKECLNSISFNYPSTRDSVNIAYFYPVASCENFKLTQINKDANLSKDGVILVNISISLNAQKGVNDEIFINEKAFIYPKQEFYEP